MSVQTEVCWRRHGVANLVSLFTNLSPARRLVLVAATVGMFLSVLAVARMGQDVRTELLYAGLDPRAAGEVVAALEQAGVPFEVRGEAIYVPAAQRDGLRMQLASQGLPATGGAGYELLDGLSGFGTTSQMFDAAYWRAKEGELARTILAMKQVKSARVHIAQAGASPFSRNMRTSASVTVSTVSGSLTAEQANALRHLVASANAGMRPEDVSVIDAVSGLVPIDDPLLGGAATEGKAAEIKRNVERLLEARVGPGNAIVEVSVDVVREREAIRQKTIDPQGRVAISSETETKSESATEGAADVTVASNLPAGDGAGGDGGQSQSSQSRERVNFEVSETEREVLREPGSIRRLTVAVLVDGVRTTNAEGVAEWQPRSEEELTAMRELVASAAGIDEARGDVLTLKSLEFRPLPGDGTVAEASALSILDRLDLMTLIQMVVLAIVTLGIALFVIRPLLTQSARPAIAGPGDAAPMALPAPGGAEGEALTGEIDDGFDFPQMPVVNFDADAMLGGHGGGQAGGDDPVARLRRLIDERQNESIEILRGWMEKEEERS
jgi:flagellar M-ring protein FliF